MEELGRRCQIVAMFLPLDDLLCNWCPASHRVCSQLLREEFWAQLLVQYWPNGHWSDSWTRPLNTLPAARALPSLNLFRNRWAMPDTAECRACWLSRGKLKRPIGKLACDESQLQSAVWKPRPIDICTLLSGRARDKGTNKKSRTVNKAVPANIAAKSVPANIAAVWATTQDAVRDSPRRALLRHIRGGLHEQHQRTDIRTDNALMRE
mmetsp:Transcript_20359/g.37218  ORF Transcript_20359/g.37218 Transcript_20359/m.37218 type:complete len:208 (+) Transcript_20359:74-697(+)